MAELFEALHKYAHIRDHKPVDWERRGRAWQLDFDLAAHEVARIMARVYQV